MTSGARWQVALVDWRPWFTDDASRISFVGQDVGRKLGRELAATAPSLRSVHVVGTSAGAWPANECVTAYVDAAPATRASAILSLTDPFTARADQGPNLNDGWGFRWRTPHLHCRRRRRRSLLRSQLRALRVHGPPRTPARSNYGASADFAEHYLNSDDIVPSTSSPLPNCYCYDITKAAERAQFPLPGGGPTGSAVKDLGMRLLGYHNWPMGYMARHYETRLDGAGKLVVPSHADLPRGAVTLVA